MHRRRPVRSGKQESDEDSIRKSMPRLPDPSPSARSQFAAISLVVSFYLILLWIAIMTVQNGYRLPLPKNAPLDKFSEERAMQHLWYLAHEIGGRQEGTEGLTRAAEYLKSELTSLKSKSQSVRLEVDESLVSGSFNLHFLRHNVAFAYRNHINVAVRVGAEGVNDTRAAVLVNGHFDSPLGSPGAGDCASCVASMLEVLRYIVDTNWIPPAPIIFLFNGAEEVFLLASHGFITSHKWNSSIGVVINVEATGASGPDLVVQAGPETWPTRIYAQSAVVPAANSIAQDVFPLIPGDTDYRIFSQDFSDIPGLDILFLLKGYVYHTAYDRPENIVPGAIQTRGDNLIALLKGFTSAKELKTASQRAQAGGSDTDRHVFFDVFGKFMIHYSLKTALFLHTLPLLVVLMAPYFSSNEYKTLSTAYLAIFKGAVIHGLGSLLGVIFPVTLAIGRNMFSEAAMTWFAHPLLAAATFGPAAIAGLLLPRVLWFPAQDSLIWASHWGAIGLYGLESVILTFSGAMSAYYPCWWALFLIPALHLLRVFQKTFDRHSIGSLVGYIIPAVIPSAYSIFFAAVFARFIAEKLGMIGANPGPLGFYLGDIVMSAVVGLAIVASVAHIIPGIAHIIAKQHVIWLLLATSLGIAIASSGIFPYTVSAPKRIILQHTFRTRGDEIKEVTFDFASVDPNTMVFVFKHAPLVRESFTSEPELSEYSGANTFLALYPISLLLSRSYKVPAIPKAPYKAEFIFPTLRHTEIRTGNYGNRWIHLELSLGSLQQVWGAAINFTGPLVNWSLSNQQLVDPEIVDGGPPSYVCRFSGRDGTENWNFWVETNGSEPLRAELGVLDQVLDETTVDLMHRFPPWAAVVAGTTYLSSYVF